MKGAGERGGPLGEEGVEDQDLIGLHVLIMAQHGFVGQVLVVEPDGAAVKE